MVRGQFPISLEGNDEIEGIMPSGSEGEEHSKFDDEKVFIGLSLLIVGLLLQMSSDLKGFATFVSEACDMC